MIAIIADIHLSDTPGASQWACLDWALNVLKKKRPSAIVVIGDITSCGQSNAAQNFRRRLDETKIPFLITAGNAELRDKTSAARLCKILKTGNRLETRNATILAVDSASATVADADIAECERELAAANGKPVVVVTHVPPKFLPARVRKWFEKKLAGGNISLLVAGHNHRDIVVNYARGALMVVRGLDPDKAIGGPPALAFMELSGGKWKRADEVFAEGSPAGLTDHARREFADLLGICCLDEPMATLDFAAENLIRCVELRAKNLHAPAKTLARKIARWRNRGGKNLFLHMPNLQFNPGSGQASEPAEWLACLRQCVVLGVNRLTIHVPASVPVNRMAADSPIRAAVFRFLVRHLLPLTKNNIKIAVENLHMPQGRPADGSCGFGYLPDECHDWIKQLRGELGADKVGFLLDVGHARNNEPFSKTIGLSDWYARLGRETLAYHVHQVNVIHEITMKNHQGIKCLYGPIISFSGFLWAWRKRQLNHAPILVEVSNFVSRRKTVKYLQKMLGA
ncbi:MAG: metallophosphoesterase [Verrucomicrobiota bacterium]